MRKDLPPASQIERIRQFYQPVMERVHENPTVRARDLDQLEQVASRYNIDALKQRNIDFAYTSLFESLIEIGDMELRDGVGSAGVLRPDEGCAPCVGAKPGILELGRA